MLSSFAKTKASHGALQANTLKIKTTVANKANEITELINILEKIDTESPLAKLNATTISDNNGGRIEL